MAFKKVLLDLSPTENTALASVPARAAPCTATFCTHSLALDVTVLSPLDPPTTALPFPLEEINVPVVSLLSCLPGEG